MRIQFQTFDTSHGSPHLHVTLEDSQSSITDFGGAQETSMKGGKCWSPEEPLKVVCPSVRLRSQPACDRPGPGGCSCLAPPPSSPASTCMLAFLSRSLLMVPDLSQPRRDSQQLLGSFNTYDMVWHSHDGWWVRLPECSSWGPRMRRLSLP